MDKPTIRSKGRDGKSLSAEYLIRTNGDGTTEVAEISVFHFGSPRKVYVANLNRVTVNEAEGSRLYKSLMTGTVKLAKEPAPRYNAKAMRSFLDAVVLTVADAIASNPNAANIFDPKWSDS